MRSRACARFALSTTLFQMRPRRDATSACGSPSCTMRPSTMIAMVEQRSVTSSTMCVDRITTTFSPISERRLLNRLRSSGSRPAVGSSTMMSRGLPMSAWAMPKRWRIPPEKPATAFLRTSQRFTWWSSVSTVCLRSPRAETPLSTARWSSNS